jgi:hypothetical protein
MKRALILFCSLLLISQGYSQGMVRDGFIEILGKKVDAPEVQLFFNSYEIKNTAGAKYSSVKNGIDIDTKKDSIMTVNVYKSSPVYGSYTGKLTAGLTFGMTAAQVNARLGKPTMAYTNSGYSEYTFAGYVITCWFEQGILNQLSYSPK